jgi:hypothetical protein
MNEASTVFNIGAVCFGLVIGWIAYRTLRRSEAAAISDIAAVVAALGGGAVVGIFKVGDSFGWYAIGLAAGFFLYLAVSLVKWPEETRTWMGGADSPSGRAPDDRKVN